VRWEPKENWGGQAQVPGVAGTWKDLAGEVPCRVLTYREILPRSRDARHLRLTAQFSFGSHLTSDARTSDAKALS